MRRETFMGLDALVVLAILLAFLFGGCAIVPPFNQYSFNETARLKREALALLKEAEESSKLHEDEAARVMAGVNRAFEDAKLRDMNGESMGYWTILLDPDLPSLAGGIRLWRANDTLSKATIVEFRRLVAENFDAISKLEGNKRR